MNCDKKDLLLYAVTDRTWLKGRGLLQVTEEALKGGASLVQLREKELSKEEIRKEALELKFLCSKYQVPFIINDNVDIAKMVKADGVHLGQSDMPIKLARDLLGEKAIIGASVQTLEQAIKAQKDGADYLGVGAVFKTDTKSDAEYVSYKTLKEITRSVEIPVIAIGGITKERIELLKESGICGVAIVSAIFASDRIQEETMELRKIAEKCLKNT